MAAGSRRAASGSRSGTPPSATARMETTFVVCNGAEGEPGTFKDRAILRRQPLPGRRGGGHRRLRGGRRAGLHRRQGAVRARDRAPGRGRRRDDGGRAWSATSRSRWCSGPTHYLFGEETGAAPGDRGRGAAAADCSRRTSTACSPPSPRWGGARRRPAWSTRVAERPTRPGQQRRDAGHRARQVLARGPEWHRSLGTERVARRASWPRWWATWPAPGRRRGRAGHAAARGDRRRSAAGWRRGATVKAVLSGVANPVLTGDQLDMPCSYEGMDAIGSGMGAAGFMVSTTPPSWSRWPTMFSRFLYVESCGQCPACKLGSGAITDLPRRAGRGQAPRPTTSTSSPSGSRPSPTATAATCRCEERLRRRQHPPGVPRRGGCGARRPPRARARLRRAQARRPRRRRGHRYDERPGPQAARLDLRRSGSPTGQAPATGATERIAFGRVPCTYDERTALLVVDVQNDFADPAGSLYVRGGEDVVAVVNAEVAAARAAGALVVYTQDWHPPDTPHFAKDGGIWPVHCVARHVGRRAAPRPRRRRRAPASARAPAARTATPASPSRRPRDRGHEPAPGWTTCCGTHDVERVVVVGPGHRLLREGDGARRRPSWASPRRVLATASGRSTCEPGDGERAIDGDARRRASTLALTITPARSRPRWSPTSTS